MYVFTAASKSSTKSDKVNGTDLDLGFLDRKMFFFLRLCV